MKNKPFSRFIMVAAVIYVISSSSCTNRNIIMDSNTEISSSQSEGDKVIKTENFVWGPDVNGLRASLEFIPEKESYSLPEIIGIRFHIQNISDHPISFSTKQPRGSDKCFLEDLQSKVIQCGPIITTGRSPFVQKILRPREVTTIESKALFLGKDIKDAEKSPFPVGIISDINSGIYKLYYELRFPDVIIKDNQGKIILPKPEDWRGKLVTGKRNFIVTP